MKAGDEVQCIDKPDYVKGITEGEHYFVCGTELLHGDVYVKVLGDDDRAKTVPAFVFRVTRE